MRMGSETQPSTRWLHSSGLWDWGLACGLTLPQRAVQLSAQHLLPSPPHLKSIPFLKKTGSQAVPASCLAPLVPPFHRGLSPEHCWVPGTLHSVSQQPDAR